MNVLFVVPWDNLGGVSHVVNRVAEHMRARGHGVFMMLPGDDRGVEATTSRAGFPSFRLRTRPWVDAKRPLRSRLAFMLTFAATLIRMAVLLRRLRIDVVNIHYPGGTCVHFAILRRLGLIRLVTSVHGADLLPNGQRAGRLPFTRALLAASDEVVMPSESYRAALRAAWPEISGPSRAIPNGVDPNELKASVAPGADDAPYILSIVQLVHYKGVDVLVSAFAAIADRYPRLRLRFVSDGPQREEYERLAASLGVADRVDFLGFISRPMVCAQLRACTLFVLPSRSNSESFGIAAAEAMALDRAVVVSRIGGLPELVEDGVSGVLVTPGAVDELQDAMRHLLDDGELRERLGRAAGERIRREFPWERTGALYERLFAELAGGAAAAAAPVAARAPRRSGPTAALSPDVAYMPATVARRSATTPTDS